MCSWSCKMCVCKGGIKMDKEEIYATKLMVKKLYNSLTKEEVEEWTADIVEDGWQLELDIGDAIISILPFYKVEDMKLDIKDNTYTISIRTNP